MKANDVKRTVDTAIAKAKLKSKAKPKLLSDNGACYVSNELKTYLKNDLKMKQVHGRPMYPQTQGKIERYHRTMKDVIKLNHFYHPEQLIEVLPLNRDKSDSTSSFSQFVIVFLINSNIGNTSFLCILE